MPRKIFSVPLNPKLNEDEFLKFYQFCEKNKEWISDIYFTCRMPPFMQDAMGDVFALEQDHFSVIETALNIQKHLGIPISATFNNIQIPPTQQNLDLFVSNFKKLYDVGVKIATIPHTHWMATGQIQAAFPDLFVKNTILRDVRTAVEVVNLAKYGFDYINLDRDIMRDKDLLIRLKDAKVWIKENLGKEIQFSLLSNEGCLGACPMMVEHFEYNNVRGKTQPQYFNDPISRVSCPKWEVEDPSVQLKTANFSPWKEDWDDYLDNLGIDVFKMHGRESVPRLFETMELIERYINNETFVDPNFENWCNETELTGKPIELWREKIRNCKFDCWECQYCDKIYEKKSQWDYSEFVKFVAQSISESGIPKVHNTIPGLTSPRVQTLLNKLASGVGSYLEIGSYLGATAASVLKNNSLNAYFVDNWKEQIQPANLNRKLPPNIQSEFEKNIEEVSTGSNIKIFNNDIFETPINEIQNIQMFFYDGPHDKESTKNALMYYYPCLANETIIIFDDANWEGVVEGAKEGLKEVNARVTYEKLILNSEENYKEWWNGLYILVVRK